MQPATYIKYADISLAEFRRFSGAGSGHTFDLAISCKVTAVRWMGAVFRDDFIMLL
jgi:hypothetical protein